MFLLKFSLASAEAVFDSSLSSLVTYFLSLFQASEEEEIVDLMVMKLFSFFGIKCKKEEKPASNDQLK